VGLRSRTKRGTRTSSWSKVVIVVWLIIALGTAEDGWHLTGEALRPGTTVSARVFVALIGFFGVGVMLGGLFLAALGRPGQQRPARPPSPRPRSVVATDTLLIGIIITGWAFFNALDLILVAPGETVTLGLGARLLVVACGFCVGIVAIGGIASAITARRGA
jgi:hypothetical protein